MAAIVRLLRHTNDRNQSSSLLGLFIYFLNFFQILFNWELPSLHSLFCMHFYWWIFSSAYAIGGVFLQPMTRAYKSSVLVEFFSFASDW